MGRSRLFTSKFIDEALADIKKLPKNVRNALRDEFEDKIHIDPVGCSERSRSKACWPITAASIMETTRVIYRVFEDIKAVSVVGVGEEGPRSSR